MVDLVLLATTVLSSSARRVATDTPPPRRRRQAYDTPAAYAHFALEGQVEFRAVLFVPSALPFELSRNMFDESSHGVKLYVKRVFINDRFEDLLPRWLTFVRGVVDSEDLPLNVGREILQKSRMLSIINKRCVICSLPSSSSVVLVRRRRRKLVVLVVMSVVFVGGSSRLRLTTLVRVVIVCRAGQSPSPRPLRGASCVSRSVRVARAAPRDAPSSSL